MTTFQQALHIFRKDARHLRWELIAAFVLMILLVITGAQSWEAIQERGGPDYNSESPLSLLLAISWSLLIARAIQTEALPGDRHFWLTRPYNRAALVLSKALFIIAFINLPFLLAQAAIVWLDGLPLLSNLGGLLWNQLLITVILLLPMAAIAALTRNLAQFLPAAVLSAGMLATPVFEHRSYGDLEWIRSSFGFFVILLIATMVVWRQYRLRRSWNATILALGATFVGVILYLSFPRSLAFAVQTRVVGSHDNQFALRLGEATPTRPPTRLAETKTPNRYRQIVSLPIAITGANAQDVHLSSARITFKTLSGITRRTSAHTEIKEQRLWQKVSLDRTFYDAAKNSPVSLRAEYYVVQFGNARSTAVPLDGTPVEVAGLGQCGVVAGYDHRRFVCRSAFRHPKPFLSERVRGQEQHEDREAYSPFPAQLRIHPVMARGYEWAGHDSGELAPATPERPAVLLVREPIAYFRYTMETPNLRLADFAITDPNENEDN